MADTIYLGTGKTVDGKFGTFYNVTISYFFNFVNKF